MRDLGVGRKRLGRRDHRRGAHDGCPASQSSSSSGLPTVADSPIRCSSRRRAGHPLEDREQVPAAVVAGESVELVDDDRPHVAQKS